MTIRPATKADLPAIRAIYASARAFMKASGNPTQWGDHYPPAELVAADVDQGHSLVVCDDEGPRGVFALIFGPDPTYAVIEGAWPDDRPYATVHRIASDGKERGVLAAAMGHVKTRSASIRMDTHADNTIMQRLLEKHGFRRCGIIHVEDGTPRLAYQWTRPQANGAGPARQGA